MTLPVQNSITPVSGDGLPAFQFLETRPDAITWHMIFDHELEAMTNIARPIVLGLSTTFLGTALGLIPTITLIGKLVQAGRPIDWADLVTLIVFGLCVMGAAVFGFFAAQGQFDALARKAEIRSRQAVAVNPHLRSGGEPIQ
ncbi:MAG: hypothetical protein Q8N10_03385 [Phenylobacterium sp.]|uniref:hypothetical protein n=1 Tax=Phenylobacterium sp. TaxID=1871053 RepID=UPI00271E085C|nr:hypothetical protein [Phenylobacterium sp.]MDO8912313.1 hypothetical protein [Phenylobacterium sp.]MDP3099525.1 hypothetical protein [Phenylobacterium sp.]